MGTRGGLQGRRERVRDAATAVEQCVGGDFLRKDSVV
jgi:hypothetical protein